MRDARRTAAYFRDHDIAPAVVLCSSSRRTRQTLKPFKKTLASSRLVLEPELYKATEWQLLERIRRVPDHVMSVLLVGHDPAMKLLCLNLAGEGDAPVLERIAAKFPTGAVATLRLPEGRWRSTAEGCAALVAFVTPRELRARS